MPKNVTVSLWYNANIDQPAFPDAPEMGKTPHAIDAMKHLGITFKAAHPYPIGDCWRFLICDNIPENLPEWATVSDGNPPQYLVDAYDLHEFCAPDSTTERNENET